VVGIEHIEDLVRQSQVNIRKDPVLASYLTSGRLKIVIGDGRQGYPAAAPYDAIHVGAAAVEIPQAVSSLSVSVTIIITNLYIKEHILKSPSD